MYLNIASLVSATLLLTSNALPLKVTSTLSSNPCLVCHHLIRHTLAFGVSTSEKLCKSMDDKSLQNKCFDYVEAAARLGKNAPKYCSQSEICPPKSSEPIEVKESETVVRKLKSNGVMNEYYQRSLTLDNGKVSLQSVAVDVETSKTNPITGRRRVTQSSHNSDDVLEIRDPKMQYKTDNENHEDEDNDDYNDNEDKQEHSGSPSSDEKKVKANSAMKTEAAKEATSNWETDVEHWELNAVRWAHAIVFYGSIYLPWLCLALLILGVMIEIFDITSNFEDDYKKQPPMTSEKVGYCIVHQTPTQKTAETNNAIVQVCKQ